MRSTAIAAESGACAHATGELARLVPAPSCALPRAQRGVAARRPRLAGDAQRPADAAPAARRDVRRLLREPGQPARRSPSRCATCSSTPTARSCSSRPSGRSGCARWPPRSRGRSRWWSPSTRDARQSPARSWNRAPRRADCAAPRRLPATLALLMYTSGHDRQAQGRDAHAREPRRERAGHQRGARPRRAATACSRCCRSTTSTPSR